MNANKGVAASGTGPATRKAPDAYAMGNGEAETGRLVRQAGFYAPFTRRMLEQAGLSPGRGSSTSARGRATWR